MSDKYPRCVDCRHARRTDSPFCFWTCALIVHEQTGRVEWPDASCEDERSYRGECGWQGKNFEPKKKEKVKRAREIIKHMFEWYHHSKCKCV